MMKVLVRQLGIWLLLASCAAAQDSAHDLAVLRDILVSENNGRPQIELVLTAPVEPSSSTAVNPSRLIIELPNTIDGSNLPKMQVKSGGVRTVEIVHSLSDPTRTRIVVELDHPLDYSVSATDERLSFVLMPVGKGSDGALTAAKRGTLTGIFHREKDLPGGQIESAHNTPLAGTGGPLARRQISQPPTSGTVQKAPNMPSQSSVGSQSGSASDRSSANLSFPSLTPQPTPAAAPNVGASPASSSQPAATVGSGAPAANPSASTPATTNATVSSASTPTVTQPPPAVVAAVNTTQTESRAPQSTQASTEPAKPADSADAASGATMMASNTTDPRLAIRAADPSLRTVFRVKYVAEGVAYLDGGRNAGLKEGVKLEIRDAEGTAKDGTSVAPTDPRVVAELEISAVAESSSVTDIHAPKRPVKVGDLAYLSSADADALVQANALSPTRKYPAVISFTEGDPEDEEVRDEMPKPPLPSVNRARGRFGFDYMGTKSYGSSSGSSSSLGMMFRGDITRIGGTYWNLSGYWRGRLTSQSSSGAPTLQDLINRTYHLSLTYANPNSNWVAGVGRLYLPWASSLDTIDGGYVGRKVSDTATVGIFGGSTPDPTSYDYAPNRSIGGAFVNFSGGDFQKFHYSSTFGAGLSMLQWKPDRPFGFLENSLSYSQRVSVYDALQVDSPAGNPVVPAPGFGLSRNFFTVRFQVTPRLELDGNHTYFRDIPMFDPTLISTGLLDKYLFQGFSAGARYEFMKNVTVYTQLGRSNRSGDTSASLNQMYGITFSHLPLWALRADFHYAEFNSSFGSGKYKAFSLSRNLTDDLHAEILAGQQSFTGLMTNSGRTWFVMNNLDMNVGSHYFVQGSFTTNRGQMSYDQWMFTLGYRFDSKRHQQ
jgi:hypothetical protein